MALPPKIVATVPNTTTLSSNDHNNGPKWNREWHVIMDDVVFYSAAGSLILLPVLFLYALFNFNRSALWVVVTLYVFTAGIFGITLISDIKLPKHLQVTTITIPIKIDCCTPICISPTPTFCKRIGCLT
ncbi:hypothetical protein FRX31_013244 [Thalictrum thalictroides]|uniref:Uncharacterized protein n=1 Tax=Thalictrum thalictroides TaxID=46969 RepID=A0A7J6WKL6_THATH|nr:hypothetical protein FRX31_013244 [Thalictrum thalictroides]